MRTATLLGWGIALGGLVTSSGAGAEPEIRPGTALDPETLPPEAQRYERLLQQDGDRALPYSDDSVDERRHFDDRRLALGLGTGLGSPTGLMGVFLEVNALDWVAVGAGAGLGAWGPALGGYLTLRPIVWGGQEEGALHAFTLRGTYTYMAYGDDPLDFCLGIDRGCEDRPQYEQQNAAFWGFAAGFEHATWTGWSFRWDIGYAHTPAPLSWRCTIAGSPASCGGGPNDALPIFSFGIAHTL